MPKEQSEPKHLFGAEVRRLRKVRGLSQAQLAAMIPTDTTYVSKVERGHRVPASESARAWDAALGAEGRLLALLAVRAAARPAQLPATVASFVGRKDELIRLDDLVKESRATNVMPAVVIDGNAGIGKTTLALRWAHHASPRFPDGQLYVDLRGYSANGDPVEPEVALSEFLIALGLQGEALPQTLTQKSALYRSILADRSVLILLDNAADSAQVEPLLPGSRACVVIVTSRKRLSRIAISAGVQRVTLGTLSPLESAILISEVIGDRRARNEAEAVGTLAARCGHLPLAIRIAAERIAHHPDKSVHDLVKELTAGGDLINELDVGESLSVRAVFSWSYDDIDGQAARLWRLLSLHPGLHLSPDSAAAVAGVRTPVAHRLLERLASVHLLEPAQNGRYQFHDLIREYAADKTLEVDGVTEHTAARRRLLGFYLHTAYHANMVLAPERDIPVDLAPVVEGVTPLEFSSFSAALQWCDAEGQNFPQLISLAAHCGEPVVGWQLAVVLWNYLLLRRHPHLWDATHRLAVDCALEARDRSGESWVLNNLAHFMRLRRDYESAERHYQQALDIRKGLGDQWGQAWTLVGVGALSVELGRPATALSQASEAYDAFVGLAHRHGQAVALCVRGDAFRDMGQSASSLQCLERALQIFDDLGSSRGRAHALTKIGRLRLQQGDSGPALAVLHRALAARSDAEDGCGGAEVLMYMGQALSALGRKNEACEAWSAALELWDEFDDIRSLDVRSLLSSYEDEHC